MDVVISDAATVSALRLWTDDTYQDYSKAVDLSAKLTGSATENITITLSDVSLPYFDGVYFLEAEDPDEVSSAIVGDLTRYKECVINKLAELSACEDCLDKESTPLKNAHAAIIGLEYAISLGFINEILLAVYTLDKFCSNECTTCGSKDNITDTTYYSTNG